MATSASPRTRFAIATAVTLALVVVSYLWLDRPWARFAHAHTRPLELLSWGTEFNWLLQPAMILLAAAMAGALRVVTVRRGVDPRAYALLAFGGKAVEQRQLIDKVVADRAPLAITRQRGEGAVLVSASEWASIEETLYLLSSPANAKRLLEAVRGFEAEEPKAVSFP